MGRLFIAEKNSQAKTLAQFLARSGKKDCVPHDGGFIVGGDRILSAAGHLLSLVPPAAYDEKWVKWRLATLPIVPPDGQFRLAVDEDSPQAVQNQERLDRIRKALAKCDEVVHMGDPDDEGQAIVDNILDYLGNQHPVKRLWAPDLSDAGLTRALASMLDNHAYHAKAEFARARSEADWLHGMNYTRAVTCTLRAHLGLGNYQVFSIGRVQTAVLGMVARRQQAIDTFRSTEYYVPWLEAGTQPPFRAVWRPDSKAAARQETQADAGADVPDSEDTSDLLVDKMQALRILQMLQRSGMKARVAVYEHKPGIERAPLPFSLSGLQMLCNRKYGYGADVVLAAAQRLYEMALCSYPRTDSSYLPRAMLADAPAVLGVLAASQSLPSPVSAGCGKADPKLVGRAWNDSRTASHHGIVPVMPSAGRSVDALYATLTQVEKNVYHEVCKRYALQFWPDAKVHTTRIELEPALPQDTAETAADGEAHPKALPRFHATGKTCVFGGWKDAFKAAGALSDPDDEEASTGAGSKTGSGKGAGEQGAALLPVLQAGQIVNVTDAQLQTRQTRPPPRFTEASLLSAMENAWRHVKDPKIAQRLRGKTGLDETDERLKDNIQSGIGTQATRADIIATLRKREFITGKKEVEPLPAGTALIHVLPESLTWPDQTALWQIGLDQIKAGKSTREQFTSDLVQHLRPGLKETVLRIRACDPDNTPQLKKLRQMMGWHKKSSTPGTCPSCGSPLERIEGRKPGAESKRYLLCACTNPQCGWRVFADDDGQFPQHVRNLMSGQAQNAQPDDKAPTCMVCGTRPLLRSSTRSGKAYWRCAGCDQHNEKGDRMCSGMYWDKDGAPNLEQGPWKVDAPQQDAGKRTDDSRRSASRGKTRNSA